MPHILKQICRLILGLSCLLMTVAAQGVGREEERTVKKYTWRNEPVKIARLKVKGASVGFDQKIVAADDWVRGLTLKVKNTSGKPIVFVEVSLFFFKSQNEGTGEPPLSMRLSYGEIPPPAGMQPTSDVPKLVLPGETVELSFTDEDYGALKTAQERYDYPRKIKEAEVRISTVVFSDGKMWDAGQMHHRDANNPGRWRPDEESPRPIK